METFYLNHFDFEIIEKYTNSNAHAFNNYFDDLENDLNIINKPLPQYVRDYNYFNYFNSDDASNTTPTNYMNNIVVNISIIQYSNADNDVLKCSINHCTCNNDNCKWIVNVLFTIFTSLSGGILFVNGVEYGIFILLMIETTRIHL